MAESLLQRWFPHPFVSVIVAMSWIMLAHNMEAGTLLMAIFLAILIPRMVAPFIDYTPNIRWVPAMRLFWVVVWDIIVANIKVAILVLGPTKICIPNGFVFLWIPSMKK